MAGVGSCLQKGPALSDIHQFVRIAQIKRLNSNCVLVLMFQGGDPGWAPLSSRRSLAPRLFLRLPICTISCGHAALFGSILCGSVIFGFCWFFKFFWVSCLFDLTVYEDFYNFFRCYCSLPLLDYPF